MGEQTDQKLDLGALLVANIERRYPTEKMDALHARWTFCACGKHHAYVRNVPMSELADFIDSAHYFWGADNKKGFWWRKGGRPGTFSAEVVDMVDVYPPPHKPWEWCGESWVFPDWQAVEQEQKAEAARFQPGDMVDFEYKGQHLRGMVTNVNKRLTIMVPGRSTRYYIPPQLIK